LAYPWLARDLQGPAWLSASREKLTYLGPAWGTLTIAVSREKLTYPWLARDLQGPAWLPTSREKLTYPRLAREFPGLRLSACQ